MILRFFKRKEKQKETVLEFILSLLSCWLISVGTALIVDAQFSFQIGFVSILWQTLFAIIAAVLFTRRWWIPIIYFGILVPVFFLAISLSGDISGFFESSASFTDWWIKGMSYDSKWYSDQGFYLVHTFINIGIAVLYFAVARIFKNALFVVATVIGFIAVNYAYGHTGYNLWAIPFIVAGIFPLISGEKFQKFKLPDVKNLFGVWGKKWILVIISTLVAVVISLGAFGIVKLENGNIRNRVCSDAVSDLQTVSNVYLKEQKRFDISLFDIGLVMNSTYVGGNLYNIKPKPLASTNLTKPTLVKVTSFDTYDGVMWDNDFEKSYRINGFWDYEQNSYFAGNAIANSSYMEQVTKVAPIKNITITLVEDSPFLATTGQLIDFKENKKTINPVLYDRRGRIFSYYGFKKDYSYTISALNFNTSEKILSVRLKGLMKKMKFGPDPLYNKKSEFYKIYTQLPEKTPEELDKIIKGLKLDNDNEYDKAYKIAQYFSRENGYVYDREPNNFKRGDDIIERLLATKKGHCVYYATAMVIMARKAGIPARFVAGYQTIQNPTGKKQIIDASSPYSWVECYIPNIGWMSFNPVPDISIGHDNSGKNHVSLGQQAAIPDVSVDAQTSKEEQKVAGTNLKWKDSYNVPAIVMVSVICLLIICLIVNTAISQSYYELDSVKKRFKSTRVQAEYYYRDILRQFSWLGFRLQKGETLGELTSRVCDTLSPDYANAVKDSIKIVEELHYGDITPTEDGVSALCFARKQLEKILKDRNNAVGYIFKRRLCLPIFCPAVKKYK